MKFSESLRHLIVFKQGLVSLLLNQMKLSLSRTVSVLTVCMCTQKWIQQSSIEFVTQQYCIFLVRGSVQIPLFVNFCPFLFGNVFTYSYKKALTVLKFCPFLARGSLFFILFSVFLTLLTLGYVCIRSTTMHCHVGSKFISEVI